MSYAQRYERIQRLHSGSRSGSRSGIDEGASPSPSGHRVDGATPLRGGRQPIPLRAESRKHFESPGAQQQQQGETDSAARRRRNAPAALAQSPHYADPVGADEARRDAGGRHYTHALANGMVSTPLDAAHDVQRQSQSRYEHAAPAEGSPLSQNSASSATRRPLQTEALSHRLQTVAEARTNVTQLLHRQTEYEKQLVGILTEIEEDCISQQQQQTSASDAGTGTTAPASQELQQRLEKAEKERDLTMELLRQFKEEGNAVIQRLYDAVKTHELQHTQLLSTNASLQSANDQLRELVAAKSAPATESSAAVAGEEASAREEELQTQLREQQRTVKELLAMLATADATMAGLRQRAESAETEKQALLMQAASRSLAFLGFTKATAETNASTNVSNDASADATQEKALRPPSPMQRLLERLPDDADVTNSSDLLLAARGRIQDLQAALQTEKDQRMRAELVAQAIATENEKNVQLLEARLSRAELPRGMALSTAAAAAAVLPPPAAEEGEEAARQPRVTEDATRDAPRSPEGIDRTSATPPLSPQSPQSPPSQSDHAVRARPHNAEEIVCEDEESQQQQQQQRQHSGASLEGLARLSSHRTDETADGPQTPAAAVAAAAPQRTVCAPSPSTAGTPLVAATAGSQDADDAPATEDVQASDVPSNTPEPVQPASAEPEQRPPPPPAAAATAAAATAAEPTQTGDNVTDSSTTPSRELRTARSESKIEGTASVSFAPAAKEAAAVQDNASSVPPPPQQQQQQQPASATSDARSHAEAGKKEEDEDECTTGTQTSQHRHKRHHRHHQEPTESQNESVVVDHRSEDKDSQSKPAARAAPDAPVKASDKPAPAPSPAASAARAAAPATASSAAAKAPAKPAPAQKASPKEIEKKMKELAKAEKRKRKEDEKQQKELAKAAEKKKKEDEKQQKELAKAAEKKRKEQEKEIKRASSLSRNASMTPATPTRPSASASARSPASPIATPDARARAVKNQGAGAPATPVSSPRIPPAPAAAAASAGTTTTTTNSAAATPAKPALASDAPSSPKSVSARTPTAAATTVGSKPPLVAPAPNDGASAPGDSTPKRRESTSAALADHA